MPVPLAVLDQLSTRHVVAPMPDVKQDPARWYCVDLRCTLRRSRLHNSVLRQYDHLLLWLSLS